MREEAKSKNKAISRKIISIIQHFFLTYSQADGGVCDESDNECGHEDDEIHLVLSERFPHVGEADECVDRHHDDCCQSRLKVKRSKR